jgi:hypothetical protein
MPLHKAAVKSSVEYAVRSKEGIAAALRDARAARLVIPARDEHARRLLFGFVVPMTLFRIALGDAQLRRTMSRRLFPPLLCLAVATCIGVLSTARDDRRGAIAASVRSEDDAEPDQDDDDSDESAVIPAVARRALTEAASASARAAPASRPPPPIGRLSALRGAFEVLTSRVVQILAGLGVVEWILVWIGREHHDAMAYETSRLTGVPAEPLAHAPKLRMDLGWVWLKGWRAVRFLLFAALAGPFAWIAGQVPHLGPTLSFAVEGGWAAYLACVFAIGNSFLAWEPRAGSPPWFVRVLERAGRVPVLGVPVRLYARLLTFATRNVWPACAAFEEAPWEAAGLALARGVASVPFVYLVFRPMFAPAATHALVGRRALEADRRMPVEAITPPLGP